MRGGRVGVAGVALMVWLSVIASASRHLKGKGLEESQDSEGAEVLQRVRLIRLSGDEDMLTG